MIFLFLPQSSPVAAEAQEDKGFSWAQRRDHCLLVFRTVFTTTN